MFLGKLDNEQLYETGSGSPGNMRRVIYVNFLVISCWPSKGIAKIIAVTRDVLCSRSSETLIVSREVLTKRHCVLKSILRSKVKVRND